jgi:hypothetical protein
LAVRFHLSHSPPARSFDGSASETVAAKAAAMTRKSTMTTLWLLREIFLWLHSKTDALLDTNEIL